MRPRPRACGPDRGLDSRPRAAKAPLEPTCTPLPSRRLRRGTAWAPARPPRHGSPRRRAPARTLTARPNVRPRARRRLAPTRGSATSSARRLLPIDGGEASAPLARTRGAAAATRPRGFSRPRCVGSTRVPTGAAALRSGRAAKPLLYRGPMRADRGGPMGPRAGGAPPRWLLATAAWSRQDPWRRRLLGLGVRVWKP